MISLLSPFLRLTLIKFNERLNQIKPGRHTVIQVTVNITCILKVSGIWKETQCRIAIVNPSTIRPNRSKWGPEPSRFLNLLKSDGTLPLFAAVVSVFSLNLFRFVIFYTSIFWEILSWYYFYIQYTLFQMFSLKVFLLYEWIL